MAQLNLFGDLFASTPVADDTAKGKPVPANEDGKSLSSKEENNVDPGLEASPVVVIAEKVSDAVQSAIGNNFEVEIVTGGEDNFKEEFSPTIITTEVDADNISSETPFTKNENPFVYNDGIIAVKIKAKSPYKPPTITQAEPIEVLPTLPQKRGRKSYKEIDAESDLIELPDDEALFQKQYYSISEVAKWFRVNTSLVRFWSNEFDILKPRKNRKGDRMFRPEDVKNMQLIYQLLRVRKFSIDGAKDFIKANKKKADTQLQLTQTLLKFKGFLLELKANLQS